MQYTEADFFKPDKRTAINVEQVYAALVQKAAGGMQVTSMRAPAISTEFVRSSSKHKARAQTEGALIEIEFPTEKDMRGKISEKFGDKKLFGYSSSYAAAAYPAGYGQRSATPLEREDTVYQMKSTFTSAAIAMSKLRARVQAREGDPSAITKIFSKLWGLDEEDAERIPNLTVAGSEATRLAALEDRAYHTLTSHPAYTGGYRVDMASVTADALGKDVPLNWARIRVAAKAIAQVQLTGDMETAAALRQLDLDVPFTITFDLTRDSQPKYTRTYPWESVLLHAMMKADMDPVSYREYPKEYDIAEDVHMTLVESHGRVIAADPDIHFDGSWRKIAEAMRVKSRDMLSNTIRLIEMYQVGRSLLADEEEDEVRELEVANLGRSFTVPTFKITTDRLTSVMFQEKVAGSRLPDIDSHGKGKLLFSLAEVRQGNVGRELLLPNALHLAVYTTTMKGTSLDAAIAIMMAVKDPEPGTRGKVASRLRRQALYDSEEVRAIGTYLFDEAFVGNLDAIIRNLVPRMQEPSQGPVYALWDYLTHRCDMPRPCPITGGLSELVEFLRTAPEGWTLYYWARVSIGKWTYKSQSSILAPIRAGEEVDLISAFKKGIISRAHYWERFYALQHKDLHARAKQKREKPAVEDIEHSVLSQEREDSNRPYIPPHKRTRQHLDELYEEHARASAGMSQDEYEQLALAQVKQKFFKGLSIRSHNRVVSVGVTNEAMRDVFIESYHARWISIDRRVQRFLKTGKKFTLGGKKIEQHPWGELITEFPATLLGVRELMESLPPIGWTVKPDVMWARLEKSITELWGDLSKELEDIMAYINNHEDEETEEQAWHNIQCRQALLNERMIMRKPITIPSYGYIAPYSLPQKIVNVVKNDELQQAQYSAATMTSSYDEGKDTTTEDDGWGDEDTMNANFSLDSGMDSLLAMTEELTPLSTSQELEVPVLTYREIWDEIGLPPAGDDQIRRAFLMGEDVRIDDPHKNPAIGPMVRVDEKARTRKMWVGKIPVMMKRAGFSMKTVLKEDM